MTGPGPDTGVTVAPAENTTPARPVTPGLWRRLACFLYEGVLLFGVVMIAGYLYSSLTQQRHALQGQTGLRVFLFAVLGLYFTWFWSHGGQTVAMKTWHLRLQRRGGGPVTPARAAARYLLCWLWFVPALAVLGWRGTASGAGISVALILGVLGYALLALFHPERQFWHDVACGTRLVHAPPPPRRKRR
jgi:uncharacterized RDD family membrane protein YckC